jgi:orotate phosphoribosyltransferase
VREAGGDVVVVGSLVDRGLAAGAFPVPARTLISVQVPSWPENECPLCAKGEPVESPGSRRPG